MITKYLWRAVLRSIALGGDVKIKIDGEEDLSVIPSVLLSPIDSYVFYGQPEKGIVMIKISKKRKKLAKHLLEIISHT